MNNDAIQISKSLNPDKYIGGTIIESGNNENGYWIKFSDGTMICYRRFGLTLDIQQPYEWFGGGYYAILPRQKFPKEFVSLDYYSINIEHSGNAVTLFLLTTANACSLTDASSDLVFSPIIDNNDYIIFNYIAIGKWKQ